MQFDFLDTYVPQQIALKDVFAAYYECRKSKRRTINALLFEIDFESKLVQLWRDINSGNYKIGRSIAFIVKHPVKREIFAANFRDRIVHHLLISKINPLFENEFIYDSYSCRSGKGTLCGVKRIREQIEQCSAFYSRECYIMKLDIRSFFMKIDKRILHQMLIDFLSEKYLSPDKPIILRLIKRVIFYNPENNCSIKGKISDWNGLPYYKSLFWSDKYCGLPIGNLTSQVFANFYLNKLDKFVTEVLGIEYYGRYVDDFMLLHQDKEVLLNARKRIENFLLFNLRLQLHPQKFYLQQCQKGVSFIGAIIKPNRIYIGKRTKSGLYQKIRSLLPDLSKSVKSVLEGLVHFGSVVNSYIGFMRHYNTYTLRSSILQKLDKTILGEVSKLDEHASKFAIEKIFSPSSLKQYQLRQQRKYRKKSNQKRYQSITKSKGEKHGSI